ncbi:hypothetical protein FAZ78_10280 [Cereibacter changlensis]|jgi:hypothetical protein|uniref:Glycine zipper 2TM domain-containing protein n=2 Tax=Cereibacter changlensis TaxID=402884 RepID=A0A2T4JQM7_9RHOB|nr:hypothetical protein [Cereibacter changlensis]MBZ4689643.1 hypothetical protein [Cereibacter sp.]PTE20087.1 hypothetical protein C5F48_19450 [Cereibacter changlensis JA139]PZX58922.1 hypothetical protein LX76_00427 [Cereibacter changlensis]TKA96645.1 hypothetical protein FAZ78_10280 [Cereibacter changlensis]
MPTQLPTLLIPGLVLMLTVAACGDTRTQRAATGALGGAVAGELISGDPITGAVIGGVGGAVLR